jgi:N-sulfoglucosamine sulfohydrolase
MLKAFLIVFVFCSLVYSDVKPNILIVISDDQSYPHCSIYGSKMVHTPNFDSIAKEGLLFNNAYCGSPGCSPSRASFLTGRQTWQIEEAGTHASGFQKKYKSFPEVLKESGYYIGHCGKGWAPGKHEAKSNPAGGQNYGKNYVKAFAGFMDKRKKDQPFCFWFGSHDAHRGFKKGSGLKAGKKLEDVDLPNFLPKSKEVLSDLLDYAFEVDRFDRDLGDYIKILKEKGEFENTIIVVTSDNGMAFPRAKANCYDFGIHVPLAIRWGNGIKTPNRTIDDLVCQIDITATIYELTKVKPPEDYPISGRSLKSLFDSDKSGIIEKDRVIFSGRERHSSVRFNSLGYPQRCIRKGNFLYIYNIKSERWPAGAPLKLGGNSSYPKGKSLTNGKLGSGFHDIDGCPTLTFLLKNKDEKEMKFFYEASVNKRPKEELFDLSKDADCLNNLINNPEYKDIHKSLSEQLLSQLKKDNDPRVTGNGDIWETYPRYSSLRWFPTPKWAQDNPKSIPEQEWLEKRRPKELKEK